VMLLSFACGVVNTLERYAAKAVAFSLSTIRQGRDQPNNHQIPLHTLAGHSNGRVSQLHVPPEARRRLHRQWPAHRRTAMTDTAY
jgi:hypothetical protein